MNNAAGNISPSEIAKFEAAASRWWDPDSEFKPLHAINPLRLAFIRDHAELQGTRALDAGCGGGILTESLALAGARTTGLDMGRAPLDVARLHALETGVEIDYVQQTVESLADQEPESFDVITCMELLEHVPDPASVVLACSRLLCPGGRLFFSTLNRNPKSYALAIVGAEYLLGMLPRGTHDYAKFIRPSELDRWARSAELNLLALRGLQYNPLSRRYQLGGDVSVNYLACYGKPNEDRANGTV
ncbi:MAG: bifunctional 2-polyprenyl-6-hydroxyphenol methylase/3-demethylubiquinol 3-O-methyltransferase UbiG [Aquisalimonadaceae bacterium]